MVKSIEVCIFGGVFFGAEIGWTFNYVIAKKKKVVGLGELEWLGIPKIFVLNEKQSYQSSDRNERMGLKKERSNIRKVVGAIVRTKWRNIGLHIVSRLRSEPRRRHGYKLVRRTTLDSATSKSLICTSGRCWCFAGDGSGPTRIF